ncbi:MAG: helix-turn-helix domain-containing protein [Ruminococcaceae bacterium]|nr:helix-turn-helix domain-containing protein [Oscillospiraceae bacterium]
MSVGENILQLRKQQGLSQEALAEKMLVSRQTVSLWETDQTQPTIDNLMRLKDIFGVSVDRLLALDGGKDTKINADSLDTVCAALAYAMGVTPPNCAAGANRELCNYVDKVFDGQKADRVVMYNPDAIAEWIYEKYPEYLTGVQKHTEKEIFLSAVMPSVTPVCFGTMYTGAQPAVHGIQKYEKPVIRIETLFDVLIAKGKRVALVTYGTCSLSRIYLERAIDYYQFDEGGIAAVNAKAMELILSDEYDMIVIYNGNYDAVMHKNGPESARALAELRLNDHVFSMLSELIASHWKHHNVLVGFAMDHGCHEIDGNCGSHGLDMPEDLNIVHCYKGYPKEEKSE